MRRELFCARSAWRRILAMCCAGTALAADPFDTWGPSPKLNPTIDAALRGGSVCPQPQQVRLNEIAFRPSGGNAQAIEIVNSGPVAAVIDDYVLADGGGAIYTVPSALPEIPVGAFVVVIFDGAGSGADDYNFDDGVAILHANASNPLLTSDELALYESATLDSTTIRDFVAWGAIPVGGQVGNATAAGLWTEGDFVAAEDGGPGLDTSVDEDGSVGLFLESDTATLENWVIYRPERATLGEANLAPAPELRSPPDEQTTDSGEVAFGWSSIAGALSYRLETDNNADFSSPEIDVVVTESFYLASPPLADGTYSFRVTANLASGMGVSPTATFTIDSTGGAFGDRGVNQVTLAGFPLLLQHKDTDMLCLEGCNRAGPLTWNGTHAACNNQRQNCNAHDNMYCARASIAMINNFYGGTLSQDRIAFEYYSPEEPGPDFDLRHGIGMYPARMPRQGGMIAGKDIFEWAMGGPGANMLETFGAPAFAQIEAQIDAGRPILIGENNNAHAVIITGYRTDALNRRWFQRTDPWTARQSWIRYPANPFPRTITEWHVCQNPANPRAQEAAVTADADGDGVVDFDETQRFGTNPNAADSDADGVNDREEVASYVFRFPLGLRRGVVDIDRDGLRTERDADSDNGGLRDGLEDRNGNGVFQPPGETDPYNRADDGPNRLDFVFVVDVTGSMLDDIQAVRASALNILNRINQTMPGWRVAVVVYRDFPILPFGNVGDFPFAVVTPFTGNIATAQNAINALPALVGGGGNIPESVYFALARTIPGDAIGGWRGGATKRAIMLFGDAPPHDPEPFTGLRRADIIRLAQRNRIGGAQRDGERGPAPASDAPVDFYNVVIGGDATAISSFDALSDETGGTLFDASGDSQVVQRILDAVDEIDGDPYADGGGPYVVQAGASFRLDASRSTDDGCIVEYRFDLDDDGTFDIITSEPFADVTLNDPACSEITLRVFDDGGNFTDDYIEVRVDNSPTEIDCDGDGLADNCGDDCNMNGTPDNCEIANGTATDYDGDGVIDSCQGDCNMNGLADVEEIFFDAVPDCNLNNKPDSCDLADGTSRDCNGNLIPDECDPLSLFRGDMNCDCFVTVADIGPFVQAIVEPSNYIAANPTCDILRADFTGEGLITVGDIRGMVERLVGP